MKYWKLRNVIKITHDIIEIDSRHLILDIAWGDPEGCTVVLKGGTISMPTDRHVDKDFIPSLKTKTDF